MVCTESHRESVTKWEWGPRLLTSRLVPSLGERAMEWHLFGLQWHLYSLVQSQVCFPETPPAGTFTLVPPTPQDNLYLALKTRVCLI